MIFAVLLISSLSLSGIAGASASGIESEQTRSDNNNIVQDKVNEQSDIANESYKMLNKVNDNQKASKTTNSTPQVSTNDTTPITTNATAKTANVSVSKPQAAAGETKATTVTSTSFTLNQIKDAAAKVKTYVETKHCLPNNVTIGTVQVKMPDFLKLLTAALLQINSKITTPVTLKTVNTSPQPVESIKNGNIYKADYLDLAKRVNAFIDANGAVPNYATSTLGKLRYESLIYAFSRVLNYHKTNNVLPNYVTVNAWSTISKSVSTQIRTVYLTSDNINGATADLKRVNTIINGLKAKGLNVVNWGIGPNNHYSVLQSSSVPANALIVNIYGGADAGVIYEMGQSYYKKLVGNRKVFSVWVPPAVNITGLAWLPRAHDDNYSPASFKGLANPDQYLKNNGYEYIYSGDLNAIIAAIYKQATTA